MRSLRKFTNTESAASCAARPGLMTLSLAVALFAAGAAHAAVVGEVIAVYDGSIARRAVMSASNGGSFQYLTCGGDLSYGGSPRYFVGTVATTDYLPDGYLANVLVASDEDCAETITISSPPNMRFSDMPRCRTMDRESLSTLSPGTSSKASLSRIMASTWLTSPGTARADRSASPGFIRSSPPPGKS